MTQLIEIAKPPEIPDRLKRVLRFTPAPVSIVTSFDEFGEPVGLAMSAIMPVALEPCSMAISINRDGSAYRHVRAAGLFCVNLLNSATEPHFRPFCDPRLREQRFKDPAWKVHEGLWYLDDAPASIFCRIEQVAQYGTHDVVIGKVFDMFSSGDQDILGSGDGSLGRLLPVTPH